MDFKIGDLVTLKDSSKENRKHTARQCKLGVILAYERLNGILLDLEIASRVFLHHPIPFGGSGSIDDDFPIGSFDD